MTTATLRAHYLLFPIEISTRRIVYWNVSEHPEGEWVAQQFRNLSILDDRLPRYLISSRSLRPLEAVDGRLGGAELYVQAGDPTADLTTAEAVHDGRGHR